MICFLVTTTWGQFLKSWAYGAKRRCCIFWPAFGFRTLQTLVKICFYHVFRLKNVRKDSKEGKMCFWECTQMLVEGLVLYEHCNEFIRQWKPCCFNYAASFLPLNFFVLMLGWNLTCLKLFLLSINANATQSLEFKLHSDLSVNILNSVLSPWPVFSLDQL